MEGICRPSNAENRADGGILPWHSQTAEGVLEQTHTSSSGLSHDQAETRLAQHGPNRLPAPAKRGAFVRLLLQFHNILIYVLLGCAAVTAALGHWIDAGVILAVVIANAVIGFVHEGKAEAAMDAIGHMLAPRANVMRGGARVSVEGEKLVPGDIVLLEAGDKVPADLRLIAAHAMSVQEAILTGESIPVEKHVEPVAQAAPLGDRSCMAFSGTLVSSGQGKGVVVATGSHTEIGRISGHIVLVSILFLSGVYGIYSYAIDRGYSVALARTMALNTLVVMEIFHLFFIRNIYGTSLTWKAVRGRKVVWTVVAIVTVAQLGVTYMPPLQAIFATGAIPLVDGVLIVGTGAALFAIIEAEKQLRLRLQGINRAAGHGAPI